MNFPSNLTDPDDVRFHHMEWETKKIWIFKRRRVWVFSGIDQVAYYHGYTSRPFRKGTAHVRALRHRQRDERLERNLQRHRLGGEPTPNGYTVSEVNE